MAGLSERREVMVTRKDDMAASALDQPIIDATSSALRAAVGGEGAFQELMAALWDPCVRLVGRSAAMRGLDASEDDVREVVTRVMTKLERHEHRALRLYGEWQPRNPDKTFADWFKITVANIVRDFGRQRRGSDQRRVAGDISKKRLLNDFADTLPLDQLGKRPPITNEQTARQLLEFARERLPAEQLAALEAWLQGASYAAIASSYGLNDAAAAKKRVRAAVAVLRRHFGAQVG